MQNIAKTNYMSGPRRKFCSIGWVWKICTWERTRQVIRGAMVSFSLAIKFSYRHQYPIVEKYPANAPSFASLGWQGMHSNVIWGNSPSSTPTPQSEPVDSPKGGEDGQQGYGKPLAPKNILYAYYLSKLR